MAEKGLNRIRIKYLVILAMVIDHLAWAFLPMGSAAAQMMHFIGRLTAPTMAFFLAEGFVYTKDRKKYGIRLFVFAVLSWIPFSLFESGQPFNPEFGVIYSLFLGYLGICLDQSENYSSTVKWFGLIILMGLSIFGDCAIYDVLIPVYLVRYREDRERQMKFFLGVNIVMAILLVASSEPVFEGIYAVGMILPALLIKYCYNGKNGQKGKGTLFHKWFFYLFYPAHLLIIYGIKMVLKG